MRALFYFFLFFSLSSYAQSTKLFQEANQAYAEANYELAIDKYEQILETGETAAEVHYNLGNAYYKINEVAPSIYHYEKALQLAPNDQDVKNNLVFAQNMAIDVVEETPQGVFSKRWNTFLNSLSTSGWAWTGIFFMSVFAVSFLCYYFIEKPLLKRMFFIGSIVFLIVALGAAGLGFSKQNFEDNQNYAIIFAKEVAIKSEPGERGEEVFLLHEGLKVKVLEEFQEWSKIELANGNQGWLEQNSIKRL